VIHNDAKYYFQHAHRLNVVRKVLTFLYKYAYTLRGVDLILHVTFGSTCFTCTRSAHQTESMGKCREFDYPECLFILSDLIITSCINFGASSIILNLKLAMTEDLQDSQKHLVHVREILLLMTPISILRAVRCKPQAMKVMKVNQYESFMLPSGTSDWTRDVVDGHGAMGLLDTKESAESLPRKIRILVLYGSLREKWVVVVKI
jgi:hypothetical protein